MDMCGIYFNNRSRVQDGACPAREFAEFSAFAAACSAFDVAEYIDGVEFSSNNLGAYEIYVDEKHKFTDVGGCIEWIANHTLSQYLIFGRIEYKKSLCE